MILKGIVMAVALLVYQTTHSEMVMPVLYGWYTDVTDEYKDACYVDHYKYENLETGTSFELAQKVLVPVNNRKDCYWQKIVLESEFYSPDDFPGTNKQWKELSKNPSVTTQKASRACVDSDEIKRDSISMTIYPSYRCPKGSYYSYDPYAYELGCTNIPMGCYGDIVGRDLDVTNQDCDNPNECWFKKLGHIGLTSPSLDGQNVIEVLNDGVVIQENGMDSFKNKTRFWGQRYGAPSENNIDFMMGIKTLVAAEEQRTCSTKYTYSWSFSQCDAENNAKFRCDSFVYYAYLAGANIDLGFTELLTYPSTIFKSMLSCRDQLGSPCSQNIPDPEMQQTNAYIFKPAVLAAKNVTQILSKEKVDISNLDVESYAYVKSKDEPRENKINLLWSLVKKHQSNPFKSSYLADILSELEPIEKTDEIIREFHKTNENRLKLQYLALLTGSMTSNRAIKNPNEARNAKYFLMTLLQTSQDEGILRETIVNYPEYFMDKGTYLIMIDRVDDQKMNHPDNFKKIVTNSRFWYKWLGVDKKDDKINPDWIDELSKQSNEYAKYDHNDSSENLAENKLFLLSKEIHRAFGLGLKFRERKKMTVNSMQSIKIETHSFPKEDELFLSDEMNETLKRLKEATAKRDAWMKNREHVQTL